MSISWRQIGIVGIVLAGAVLAWRVGLMGAAALNLPQQLGRFAFGLWSSLCMAGLIWLALRLASSPADYRRAIQPFQPRLRSFGLGILCFLVPAAIGSAIALGLGFVRLVPLVSGPELLRIVLTLLGLVLISEALPEEILFRGYIFHSLGGTARLWFALVGQALLFLLFAWLIGAVADPLDGSFLFTFALVLGLLRVVSQDIWAAIGFHTALQTAQQLLSPAWAAFEVTGGSTFQIFLLGMIPISATIAIFWERLLNARGTARQST